MKNKRIFQNQDDINQEILRIKALMKENKDLRMHERYQIILLVLNDMLPVEISKITGHSLSTVYNYLKAYEQGGTEGLKMGYSSGRPRFLTQEQEKQAFQTIVDKTPADVGFPANMNWTSPIIRRWIEQEFGVAYSDRGTRELLYRLGLSFTAPTYKLAKADASKQEAFKQDFEEFKKNSSTRK